MKKRKLSEVDLNAKTLNNKDADYYNHTKIGLRDAISALKPSIDANDLTSTGFYSGGTVSGVNYPTDYVGVLMVLNHSASQIVQVFFTLKPERLEVYVRSFRGEWSPWRGIDSSAL